jgi:hypothetical protein
MEIGLTLNEDKCEILSRDGKVEFLSQTFLPSPVSFTDTLDKRLEKLQE